VFDAPPEHLCLRGYLLFCPLLFSLELFFADCRFPLFQAFNFKTIQANFHIHDIAGGAVDEGKNFTGTGEG
jgi:hypothetical protein